MYCVKCNKSIIGDEYKLIAIEVPYYNVFFHVDCYNDILKEYGGWEGLSLYLANNFNTWYNKESKVGKRR